MRASKHDGKIPESVRDEIVASIYRGEGKSEIAKRLPVSRRTVTRIYASIEKRG